MQATQVVVFVLALFFLARVVKSYKQERLSPRETIAWIVVITAMLAAAASPSLTVSLFSFLGLESPVNLLIYISIIALFYSSFLLYVKLEKVERDLTKVVRELALLRAGKRRKK